MNKKHPAQRLFAFARGAFLQKYDFKAVKTFKKASKKPLFCLVFIERKTLRFLSYFCSFPKFSWLSKFRRKHRPAGFFRVKNDQNVSFSYIPVGLSGIIIKFWKFVFCYGQLKGEKGKNKNRFVKSYHAIGHIFLFF